MLTQRSKARVWNIHVVFEPPTPPTSRPAQRPHGRCFTLEAPSGSSGVVAGAALQTGEPRPRVIPATAPIAWHHMKEPTSLVDRMLEPEVLRTARFQLQDNNTCIVCLHYPPITDLKIVSPHQLCSLNIKNPASHSAADQHISDQHILLLSPASGSGPRVARRARWANTTSPRSYRQHRWGYTSRW